MATLVATSVVPKELDAVVEALESCLASIMPPGRARCRVTEDLALRMLDEPLGDKAAMDFGSALWNERVSLPWQYKRI